MKYILTGKPASLSMTKVGARLSDQGVAWKSTGLVLFK